MLTYEDLAHVEALWTERVGLPYSLEVVVIGEHGPVVMDPDRPLGAIVTAELSLRLIVRLDGAAEPLLDEPVPYSREALLASVRAISGLLLKRG